MRVRPVEQVVDRDAVANERALALLLCVQAAKPLVARPAQGDAVGRREWRRPAELAETGGEKDTRGAIVAFLSRAGERLLEHSQEGVIGGRVGEGVSCGGCLRSTDSANAVAPRLRIDPIGRAAHGNVEERELATAARVVDSGAIACRIGRDLDVRHLLLHAGRIGGEVRHYFANTSPPVSGPSWKGLGRASTHKADGRLA